MFQLKNVFMNEALPEGQPGGGAAAPEPVAQPQSWYSGFDDTTRGYIESKGFKDPQAVVTSYQNLEKLMGHDRAGRTVVLPKDETDVDAYNSIYDKLGRPASAEDYKLPVPEGDAGEFAKLASGKFHELGLTAKQGQALAEWYNGHVSEMAGGQSAEVEQKRDADFAQLEKEWGDQFNTRSEIARRAMQSFGLTAEQGSAMEDALGVATAAKMFEQMGIMMSEHGAKGFENSGGGKFNPTPQEAQHQINQLTQDQGWQKRYFSGDVAARNEMERLQKIAYPG